MSKKTLSLKCTSAFVVGGKIITPDQVVHDVPKADALNLIQRGKAEEVLDGDDSENELSELHEMTVEQLRQEAKEYEIEGAANMKKAELIEAIEAAEGDGE